MYIKSEKLSPNTTNSRRTKCTKNTSDFSYSLINEHWILSLFNFYSGVTSDLIVWNNAHEYHSYNDID